LAAIRELLARAAGGLPHPAGSAFPGLASSAPIAAKLVAGVAVVAVAGGTLAAVERHPGETRPRAAPPRSLPVRASAGAAAPEPVRRVHLAPRSAAPRGVSVATAVRRGPPAAQPPPPWTALRRSMPAPVARSPVRPLPVVAAPLAQPPGAPARAAEPGATQSPPEAESSEAMPVAGDEGHAVTNEEERSTSSGPGDGEVADEEGPGSDSSGSGSSGSGSEGEGSPESAGEGSASTGE